MKIDTIAAAIFSSVSGFIAYAFGGWDLLLQTLAALVIMDFITGTGAAIYNHTLSSRISADGVIRKIFIGLTVIIAVIIQHFVGDVIPIREITISFYIFSEGMSNIENIGKVIPYPEKLKQVFRQLNGEGPQSE